MKRKMKVLAIDDDINFMKLLKLGLADRGYEAVTTTSPLEGIQMADAELPNVILLDYNMPGVDGVDTLRALKSARSTAKIPVLMLSGEAESRDVLESLREGAAEFLDKKAKDLTALLDRLEEAIGRVARR